jgi:hypothetical protein
VESRPQTDFLFASRVLAIAAHYDVLTSPQGERAASGPDYALAAMWGPLRHRFDPELLWVFLRTMARKPLKVMPRGLGGVVDPPAPPAAPPTPTAPPTPPAPAAPT